MQRLRRPDGIEISFVLAPEQNDFFFELAEVLRFELEELGVQTSLSTAGFPALREGLVYALLPPHEYFALAAPGHRPAREALRRTLLICAEQPETHHFRQNAALAPAAGPLFDINFRSVKAYRRRGFRAEHLRLGYTPAWDRYGTANTRDVDVLFLGAHTERRARILAEHADLLARLRSRLVFSDNSRPNPAGSPGFLAGEDKWSALSQARILLNIHQGDEPYFEWHRVLQAIHCGTAVVTETSTDFGPLESGTHMQMGTEGALGRLVEGLAEAEADRSAVAGAAYELIRSTIPLSAAAERIAEAAASCAAGTPRQPTLARVSGGIAAARLKVEQRRGHSGRPPHQPRAPGGGLGLRRDGTAAGRVAVLRVEDASSVEPVVSGVDEELTLLLGADQVLLDGALALLETAVDTDDAAFAYGITLAHDGQSLRNVFAETPAELIEPPILIRTRDLDQAVKRLEVPFPLGELMTAISRDGRGCNAQTLVARAV